MEEKLDELEFWLPSEFLTDEDILMDQPALSFPFDFGSSSDLSSPVESLVGSTEPESSSDEEDSALAEISRQITLLGGPKLIPLPSNREKKSMAVSGSPQSTLTKVGSWSGRSNGSSNGPSQVSSPPTTPLGLETDPWDLIYQAAGQIARLKMNGADSPTPNPTVFAPPPPPFNNTTAAAATLYDSPMMNQDACGLWSRETQKNAWRFDSPDIFNPHVGVGSGLAPWVWPSQQRGQQQLTDFAVQTGAGFGYGFGYATGVAGPTRAGTGVFLPRRYDNKPADSRRKPASALHQNKPANAWNNNNGGVASANTKPGYAKNDAVSGGYGSTMASRNAAAPVQPSRNVIPDDICLPQEWTY